MENMLTDIKTNIRAMRNYNKIKKSQKGMKLFTCKHAEIQLFSETLNDVKLFSASTKQLDFR